MEPKQRKALFRPFRALGYITDSVPFAVQRRGKETYVTVSVGKAWQVYNCSKLTLVLVGPQLPGTVRALAAKGELTLAAVGNVIIECKRVHKTGVYAGHLGPILQLLVLGDQLLSLSQDGQVLCWALGQHARPLSRASVPAALQPTCMAHPDTYLNKVVVGGQGGQLALLNYATGQVLYTFAGWGAAVRALAVAPALDVVGVALADGRAALLNLKYDETVAVFNNAAGVGLASRLHLHEGEGSAPPLAAGGGALGPGAALGVCTSLSFRTGAGIPLMAVGGGSGVVTVWNLEDRRLHAVLPEAHDASLVALHFFAGEPLLMSAGADNALKHWVFEGQGGEPRLLRFRSGHAAPPSVVMHYGEGLRLLSAGSDRAFRVFSTIQDQQSRELSQKHTAKRAKKLKLREVELKLQRVTCLDACTVRERDWANVLTGHQGDATAYVWRLAHFTLGEHELRPPEPPPDTQPSGAGPRGHDGRRPRVAPPPHPSGGRLGAPVSAVALSPCGNFGLVGSESGRVDRYNMQSGLHRGAYGRLPPATQQPQQPQQGGAAQGPWLLPAHDGPVTGLRVDSCNRQLASVGLDGRLRLWDFKTFKLLTEVEVGSPATHLAMAPGSGLVAVACDDRVLRCFDVEAGGRLVRRFKGHQDRITCIQLSADGRWLLSSSMDGSLRVWDVPAAMCLQVLRLGAPITSFSLPPAMDLLATCHVNRRGIYLWSNSFVFGNPGDFTPSDRPVDVALPTVAGGGGGFGEGGAAPQRGDKAALKVRIAGGGAKAGRGDDDDEEDDEEEQQGRQGDGAAQGGLDLLGPGLSLSSDEDEGYDDDGRDHEDEQESAAAGAAGQAAGRPWWDEPDPFTGTPQPLAPALVTLSLLPRTQWHSLLHLETIKARNKPIEPVKKGPAAPFFLPTIADVSGNVVFDTSKAEGEEADEQEEGEEGAAAASASGGASRVLRLGKRGAERDGEALPPASEFVRLLRACVEAGDWASFTAHLRGLSPAALDREVRALQILDLADEEDEEQEGEEEERGGLVAEAVRDVAALLEAVDAQLAQGSNFEFTAALLQLVLQVHGEAISRRRVLRDAAARVSRRLTPLWARLDGLLGDVRCMTAFFANLQG